MKWNEIIITIPTARVYEAENIANMVVSHGIYTEDYSDLEQGAWDIAHIDLIDEELLKSDRDTAKIHIFIDAAQNPTEERQYLEAMLAASDISHSIDIKLVDDADWSENWKKYFKQINVGKKLSVCPSWEEPVFEDGRKVLMLDPGAAFGTGAHATTRLCMELLEDNCPEGCRMLDLGCGSGILAIAAAKLGAGSCFGVDIDPIAVKVAKENSLDNSVGDITEFREGSAELAEGEYDVICANIVADVIIMLASDIARCLKAGCPVICSGIIEGRQDEVIAALEKEGLKITRRIVSENWHAIAAVK